jgi:hypothetical protein
MIEAELITNLFRGCIADSGDNVKAYDTLRLKSVISNTNLKNYEWKRGINSDHRVYKLGNGINLSIYTPDGNSTIRKGIACLIGGTKRASLDNPVLYIHFCPLTEEIDVPCVASVNDIVRDSSVGDLKCLMGRLLEHEKFVARAFLKDYDKAGKYCSAIDKMMTHMMVRPQYVKYSTRK